MKDDSQYRLGLALSGGGAKGLAHLGVLQVLNEHSLKPNIISGTSAGALAAVFYADGYTPKEIMSFFDGKDFRDFAALSIPQGGLFKNERFHSFLEKHLRAKTFDQLRIPLRVVATDIEYGVSKTFDSGNLVSAVVASCSYPVVFAPQDIGDSHYVDGGLFKNFPVSVIREDCDFVIGVNVAPLNRQKYKKSLFYVLDRSFHYLSVANTLADRQLCDVLIESNKLSKFPTFSLDHNNDIYNIGYEVGKLKLEQNLALIQNALK